MDFSFLYNTNRSRLTLFSLLVLFYLADSVRYQLYTILGAIVSILVLYALNAFSHWEKVGIPFISESFPFGYMTDVMLQKTSFAEKILDLYKKAGKHKYVGVYSIIQPQIFVKDVDLVKTILVKDFNNFTDHGVYVNPEVDKLTANLFGVEGQMWKNLRTKISPTFTGGKLKTMYGNVKKIANDLTNYTADLLGSVNTVNVKDISARFGLDVISSIALGLEGNNFKEDNTEMKRITSLFIEPSAVQVLRTTTVFLCRDIAKLLRLRMSLKEVEDYFFQITKDTVKYRRDNNIKRNDFMNLLMNLEGDSIQSDGTKQNVNNKVVVLASWEHMIRPFVICSFRTGVVLLRLHLDVNWWVNTSREVTEGERYQPGQISLTLDEMAAQSFAFVIGGFETTSTTVCFMVYELAMNPQIQDRLIEEIDAAGPDVQYDELLKLPYLDMVLSETLRKHAPVPVLQRECANDYKMPDDKIVKGGTIFLIPVFGLHRDPELYPDPEKFHPERFNKDNIKNIPPYSYLPFGEGPRICIGYRFALLQIKLAVHAFFSRFKVAVSEKTPLEMKLEKKTFLYNSKGGLWLRVIDRTKQTD